MGYDYKNNIITKCNAAFHIRNQMRLLSGEFRMPNFLISYYSDYGDSMYISIGEVLKDNGNNIYLLNVNDSNIGFDYWGGTNRILDKSIIDSVNNFNPDIVLNFNFSVPEELLSQLIYKKCKICIVDADYPDTFWNKKTLIENKDCFYYLGLQSHSKSMYEKFLGIKLTNKNYLYFPPATAVDKYPSSQSFNISFIGSNFYPLHIPEGEDFYSDNGLTVYDKFKTNYFLSLEEVRKICPNSENPGWVLENIGAYYVGQERLKYLQSVSDLGLTIFGSRGWEHIAAYDFELAKCYNRKQIKTLEENQWVYNSSKISINISHPQAITSFSWRVMDIMASNSCLLMERKKDWRDLFQKYISNDTLDLIIYKDRFDMREKAKLLLNDDGLRENCVIEVNNSIMKNGRWNHRFPNLEKLIGASISYLPHSPNSIIAYGDCQGKPDSYTNSHPMKQFFNNILSKTRGIFK